MPQVNRFMQMGWGPMPQPEPSLGSATIRHEATGRLATIDTGNLLRWVAAILFALTEEQRAQVFALAAGYSTPQATPPAESAPPAEAAPEPTPEPTPEPAPESAQPTMRLKTKEDLDAALFAALDRMGNK